MDFGVPFDFPSKPHKGGTVNTNDFENAPLIYPKRDVPLCLCGCICSM